MRIGELAARAGVSPSTVRYYERRGLLQPAPRTPAGYRLYGTDEVKRMRFIKHAQRLGFTLPQIQELMALRIGHASPCGAVREQAEVKLSEIRSRMQELGRMQEVLERLVASCETDWPAPGCPIVDVLDGDDDA